ncbi:nitrite reductase (NAD(P)H) small subunit [Jonesia quinghaiensis]|uniref:nitrite reductase (NAD(P)H) small subunit n=1 Tax=Jonesia quinghaiensis TaxID=262806 RepID=UPI000422E3C1|nr:nitrite reductase (NAD(P)H) small subunit [Jonesia quinghaiensis]
MSTVLEHTPGATTTAVCRASDVEVGWGVAALLPWGQAAVFRTLDGSLFAVDNRCPCCSAAVIARGIVGDRTVQGARVPTVACPLHKHVFRLDTGESLTGAPQGLRTLPLHRVDDTLFIGTP